MLNIQELSKQAEGNQEIVSWINNTLSKKAEETSLTEAEHIIDYLKSDKAPKRLRRMSVEQAKLSAEKWTKALIKKGNNIIETEEDVETVKQYSSGARWVQLISKNSFKREGSLMRHCVGDYHGKENVKIYSLRDNNNQPHCTIEVTGEETINQVKGKGNGCIHPKYIKFVLGFLSNQLKMEVRSSEMENLGYLKLNDMEWGILANFDGVKELTVKGNRYFYKFSNLKLK